MQLQHVTTYCDYPKTTCLLPDQAVKVKCASGDADNGVDGVKVDVQATVGLMGSKLGGGPAMTSTYHRSLESSVRAAFPGNHCINCMCHSTENLYRYGLATTALTA